MSNIPTITQWPEGSIVDSVEGKIVGVYERKTIQSQYGPKTVQNAELQDAAGNKIRLSVWEHPELSEIKGLDVVLHSTPGKGGKQQGVSVKHSQYTPKGATEPKKTVELQVGKAGVFQYVAVYKQQNPGAATDSPKPAEPVKEVGYGEQRNMVTGQTGPTNEDRLTLIANLWSMCFDKGMILKKRHELNDDQFQACVSSLFIQATRDNIKAPLELPPF